jgi:hypothetical protein
VSGEEAFYDAGRAFESLVAFPVVWWVLRGVRAAKPWWVVGLAYAFAASAALRGVVLILSAIGLLR